MDYRIPLSANTVLEFDGMRCHVESVIGCGSNAIVYQGWYPDQLHPEQRHRVLIKELFPLDHGGMIRRSGKKGIVVEPEAAALWQDHKESFLQGNRIHLRLLEDHPERLGANLNSFEYGNTLYSVLGFNSGRTLLAELTTGTDQSLRQYVRHMLALLDALEAFHKSGYLHLDISPANIMLTGSGEREYSFLIDFNSAQMVNDSHALFSSIKDGYAAPEVEEGEISIGFEADLYSVAAVFFRCLMGRTMTLFERLQEKVPDCRESTCMKDQPQTVSGMVSYILRKGLHPLPQRRFRSIGQMRQAFAELQNRIDGVGVTHWSLWENGKHSVERLIRTNPSLRYILEAEQLYPIRVKRDEVCALQDYLEEIMSPNGNSGYILASGGMGKTTLLLHSAMLLSKQYSPSESAVFYLSLDNWNARKQDYICSQILMRLRFKPEENTYDSARHALIQLLSKPLQTRKGPKPVVLILLDGLNEVREDLYPLIQEIREISALAGVRILAASRRKIPELPLMPAHLLPLQSEDIEIILGRSGMLLPQDADVQSLLRTPLILSAFIKVGTTGIQPEVHNESELIQAYLHALVDKELCQLPEDAPEHWQIDAALRYILPRIADAEKHNGGSLSHPQMLQVIQGCWKDLHGTRLHKHFPQWIGHSRDIFGDAQTAEQWYGQVIHRQLWQRMGLLLQDSSGNYRIFHQTVRDHLADMYLPLKDNRRRKWMAVYLLVFLGISGLAYGWNIRSKQNKNFEKAIDYATVSYVDWGNQYTKLRQLTDDALIQDLEGFESEYLEFLSQESSHGVSEELYLQHIGQNILPERNQKVSWSNQPFEGELALELVSYASERRSYYRSILPILAGWMASEELQEDYPELMNLFSITLEAEADLAAELYHQVCGVHLENGDVVWQQNIHELVAMIPQQEDHRILDVLEDRKQYLENLRTQAAEAKRDLSQDQAGVAYSLDLYPEP